MKTFTKSFLQQEPLPDRSIDMVTEVMESGRLHRYDVTPDDPGHAALLEQEFAEWQGSQYCLACASCGYALYIAMLAVGVTPGDIVLCNAFTLAPVPSAIHNCGATPRFVEIDEDLTIDLADLELKAVQADYLLLSHMRGHLSDMDRVVDICRRHEITLIEDCAHSLGAWWADKRSGSYGEVSCFSTQSYKHMNSGEGGLLVTDNPDVISKAILLSGSYMLFDRHLSAPDNEAFVHVATTTPNYSGRMDNMRAASLRPQLSLLASNVDRWNHRYGVIAEGLQNMSGVVLPQRNQQERYVGSSIQFLLPKKSEAEIDVIVAEAAERGVQLKYFGQKQPHGYTSRYDSWKYLDEDVRLPKTLSVLTQLLDMRIPLTFDIEDCQLIVEILGEVLDAR